MKLLFFATLSLSQSYSFSPLFRLRNNLYFLKKIKKNTCFSWFYLLVYQLCLFGHTEKWFTARRCNGWLSASFAIRAWPLALRFPIPTDVPIVLGSPMWSVSELLSTVLLAMYMFVPGVCALVRLPAQSDPTVKLRTSVRSFFCISAQFPQFPSV